MHLRKRYVIAVLTLGIHAALRAQELPRGVGAREVTLYAQLLAMTDTRRLDTVLVDRALASSWAPMRAVATLAIGQVGVEPGLAGASRLRGLLRDRDVTVAANAAYALGLLRDSAAIADLAAALALDHRVAREAAWALGEIGGPAPRTALDLARGRESDDSVRAEIEAAMARS